MDCEEDLVHAIFKCTDTEITVKRALRMVGGTSVLIHSCRRQIKYNFL
jgi:hypothetical protein